MHVGLKKRLPAGSTWTVGVATIACTTSGCALACIIATADLRAKEAATWKVLACCCFVYCMHVSKLLTASKPGVECSRCSACKAVSCDVDRE